MAHFCQIGEPIKERARTVSIASSRRARGGRAGPDRKHELARARRIATALTGADCLQPITRSLGGDMIGKQSERSV